MRDSRCSSGGTDAFKSERRSSTVPAPVTGMRPSASPVVPLHRWVDVAIAIDETNGQCYAYIDGQPFQLSGTANSDPFRVSTSIFTVGEDSHDDQFFKGK